MEIAIDTSAYSAFYRGDPSLKAYFTSNNSLHVPYVVIAELKAGFAAGTNYDANLKMLNAFVDQPNVKVLLPTIATTDIYASIFASLRKNGTPIGFNDMWIASIALEHSLALLTLDKDFSNIPDLLLA